MENKIGKSINTFKKQEHFKKILDVHLKINKHIFNKYFTSCQIYNYIDLNAGSGKYYYKDKIIYGSPLIIKELIKKHAISSRALFYEIDTENSKKLESNLIDDMFENWKKNDQEKHFYFNVLNEDHKNLLNIDIKDFLNEYYNQGLLYSDENGNLPPIDLLKDISLKREYYRIDFLLYVASVTYKRCRGAFENKKNLYLLDEIKKINKKYWLIREPDGKYQWTFLFGTNWKDFPEFKKIGFYKLDSKEGQEIAKIINFTKIKAKF